MGGPGTPSHISGELFRLALKLDRTAIPFNGGGPMARSRRWRRSPPRSSKGGALAVTSKTRSSVLPDVPTLADAGYPDQENDTSQGILAPAGTSQPTIALLNLAKAMASPDVQQKMLAIGFEPVATTPEEFAERIRIEIPRRAKIIREAHITPE